MQPHGGFWLRFVAYIIDAVILNVVSWVIMMVAGVGVSLGGAAENVAVGSVMGAYGVSFVINWLYSAVLESSEWQATVGKKAMSLVVTDSAGQRIGFGRATGRYFSKFISVLILGIGFLMVGWTRRKQGLHDMMAGTLVYKTNAPELLHNSADVFS